MRFLKRLRGSGNLKALDPTSKCMKLLFALLLVSVTLGPINVCATTFPSLEQTLQLAKSRAYYASNVVWSVVEAEAKAIAENPAKGEGDAIRHVLRSLKDQHSFLRPKPAPISTQVTDTQLSRQPTPIANFEGVETGIGVLSVNGWMGNPIAAKFAAQIVRTTLLEALSKNECGVIVDFSANDGGNMWPMASGLAPLFSDGSLGFFKNNKGEEFEIAKLNGAIAISGWSPITIDEHPPLNQNVTRKIAIVIGQQSASSGEIVPILFASQSNVKFFGKATRGIHSANETFTLANGGIIALTTAITLSRTKQAINGPFRPDVASETPRADAAKWVLGNCK